MKLKMFAMLNDANYCRIGFKAGPIPHLCHKVFVAEVEQKNLEREGCVREKQGEG